MENERAIAALAGALRDARRVVVLTGAGVSAESGIPTFRDAMTGLWAKFDPADLATPEAFEHDPELVTRWYDERRRRCLQCQPNPGHTALARLESDLEHRGGKLTLLTQNVDRLHQRAGSRDVVELHGSIMVWRCTETGEETEPGPEAFARFPPPSACGAPMRPAVVWFGEMLPPAALARAHESLEHCDLFLSVGTSSVVQPAASFVHVAALAGAQTGEVNPEETPISGRVDWSVRGKSGDFLARLAEAAFGPTKP